MKILVASINFAPDHAGIGLYSTDFPVYLAEQGDEVSMVTGFPYYPRWEKNIEDRRKLFGRATYKDVQVYRGYLYVPRGRVSAVKRLIHELSFSLFAAFNFFRVSKPDAVVVFTPPFFLGLVGLLGKWWWRVPLIINIQDLPLDAAVALGMVRKSLTVRVFQALEKWIYKRADMVCSISRTMIENVREKGVHDDRIALIPNWVDVSQSSIAPPNGAFRSLHERSQGKFLVAYAGNIGMKQGIGVLLHIAKKLESEPLLHFYVIGDGADKQRLVELANELEITNVTFLPFLNQSEYQEMLSDVDVVFIAQKSGAGNNFFPSKLLGLMSRSKPLLVAADSDSELASTIREAGCGLVSNYDDVDELSRSVRRMSEMGQELAEMGHRGFEAVNRYDRQNILQDWRNRILSLLSRRTA